MNTLSSPQFPKPSPMKGGTRLILLHPTTLKSTAAAANHRLWILALLSLSTLTFLLTSLTAPKPPPPPTPTPLSPFLTSTLLHYAAASKATDRMSAAELSPIATALRGPSNLLVFGITPETLLWLTLNLGGRTVFLDENEHLISHLESHIAGFEGYDVQYTTKLPKSLRLISSAKSRRSSDCRPVQNLLFSDCWLAINDLPNHLYTIPWDVIIVDGPSGFSPKSPGRTSAIFTAGVLARSRRAGGGKTDVFVHDFGREVERVSSEEFLCMENLVEVKGSLAHFAVPEMEDGSSDYCTDGGRKGKVSRSSPVPA